MLQLLGAVTLVALGFYLIANPAIFPMPASLVGRPVVFFFGICGLVAIAQIARPCRLTEAVLAAGRS